MLMSDSEAWKALLAHSEKPEITIHVETFAERYHSASNPARVTCNDQRHYVLKGPQSGQPQQSWTAFNEQTIASLGQWLDAPIPPIEIVRLTGELRAAESNLQHFIAGPLHASEYKANTSGRMELQHAHAPENRSRAAALVVLYTWTNASDHQVIYELDPPNLMWSVDHGHFFVGDPNWTAERLRAVPLVAGLDQFFQPLGLRPDELGPAFSLLEAASDEAIAQAVARPPDEWGVTIDERVALCVFLSTRRRAVLALRQSP
jgi:hypothetical protein